jgi:hypothetical protein
MTNKDKISKKNIRKRKMPIAACIFILIRIGRVKNLLSSSSLT